MLWVLNRPGNYQSLSGFKQNLYHEELRMQFPKIQYISKAVQSIATILVFGTMTVYSQDLTVNNLKVQQSANIYGSLLLRPMPYPAPSSDYCSFVKLNKDTILVGEFLPAPCNKLVLTRTSLSMINSEYGTNSVSIGQNEIRLRVNIPAASSTTLLKQGTADFSDGNTNKTTINYNTITSTKSTGNTKIDGASITVNGGTAGTTTISGGNVNATKINAVTISVPSVIATTLNTSNLNTSTMVATGLINGPYAKVTNLDVTDLTKASVIKSQELYVLPNIWADYVFKPEYQLQSLEDVGSYIKRNGRLPGIPSETEVAEKGVSVGEIQTKLLEKIEEMTLHMIRMQERIAQLEAGRK